MAITANSTPPKNALDFTASGLDGKDVDLSRWRGKVVLVVNVASKCGLTPQYAALQKHLRERLEVLRAAIPERSKAVDSPIG